MEKIKEITLINQSMGLGGAEKFFQDLLLGFKKQGVQIKIFTTHSAWIEILDKVGLEAHRVNIIFDVIGNWKGLLKAFIFFPAVFFQYFKIVYSTDSNLILLSGFGEKIIVSVIAKLLNKKVIWVEFSPLSHVFKKFAGLPKILYGLVKNIPQKIFVPTVSTKRKLVAEVGFDPAKIVVVGCGSDIDPDQVKKVDIVDNSIVCLSRLEKGKGQDLLIKAMPQVLTRFPDAKLFIIGEGDFEVELKSIVKKLDLAGSVNFMGRVRNAWGYLKSSSLVVFPSVWELEGFGLVVTEAMALAKPIVAFDRNPTNEILKNDKTALLAKEGNVDDLASKIMKVLEDKKLAARISANAKITFDQKFHISRIIDNYLNEIEKVI